MTAAAEQRVRQGERLALGVALLAAVVAIVLGFRAPHDVVPAWRLAGFACLQPAIGSVIFILIYRLTGGQWLEGLAPFLLAGTRLLPWIWLLIVPLAWFPMAAQPQEPANDSAEIAQAPVDARSQTEDAVTALEHVFATSGSRHLGESLRRYFSPRALELRALGYALGFFLLAAGARKALYAKTTLRWYGPVGLIGLVFLLHLLATDWLTLLDPGWYSTAFPLVWIVAQAVSGLAAAIVATLACGAMPASRGSSGHVRGIDWGNLLLASMMSWAYVGFLQFLIIWAGNMPAETSWYRHRAYGGWHWFLIGMVVIEFGAPFFLLLSRGAKKRGTGLAAIAALLILGQLAFTTWLIAPAFPTATTRAPALLLAVFIAALAALANRYLAAARRASAALAS